MSSNLIKDDVEKIDFAKIDFQINSEIILSLKIWSSCVHDAITTITDNLIKGTQIIALVYDITSFKSFENLTILIEEIKKNKEEFCKIVLVGNKIDLEHLRKVNKEMIEKFCKENKIELCCEISAQDGSNVINFFEGLARIGYSQIKQFLNNSKENYEEQISNKEKDSTLIRINTMDNNITDLAINKTNPKKCWCC